MADFKVGQDIGGFGRLANVKLQMRREDRLDKEFALRQRLSNIQLQQAEANLEETQRKKQIVQGLTNVMQNIPDGENRFTASYKYLMGAGAADYADDLLKRQSETIEKIKKVNPQAAYDLYNKTIGKQFDSKIKPIPDIDNLVMVEQNGREGYLQLTKDGFKFLSLPEGTKLIEKKKGKNFDRAAKIRAEIDKASNDFYKISNAYDRVTSAAAEPSAAGDLALIFNYMKILDPGSVVRESEFQTAADARAWMTKMEGSDYKIPSVVAQGIEKLATGKKLLPEQRADFIRQAGNLYRGQKRINDITREEYLKLAEYYGLDRREVDIKRGEPLELKTSDMPKTEKELDSWMDKRGEELERQFIKDGLTPEEAEKKAFSIIKKEIEDIK